MITEGSFNFFFNGESKTRKEIGQLIDYNTTVSIKGLDVFYSSPKIEKLNLEDRKKEGTIQEILKGVEEYQKQNGGILKGVEFPFDYPKSYPNLPPKKDDEIGKLNRLHDIKNFLKILKEQKVSQEWNGRVDNIIRSFAESQKICDTVWHKALRAVDTEGKKESQTEEKPPIFTYCNQMKNAIEALSLRSLCGHKKYEKENDWENFSRVPNGDFEYSNAQFRHALNIGIESERDHRIAEAWNAVARLEIYLRNN